MPISEGVQGTFRSTPLVSAFGNRHSAIDSALTPSVTRQSSAHGAEQPTELLDVDWLHRVLVEPGFARPLPVALLAVTGHRDDIGIPQSELSHPATDFIAVHPRQPDIEQDNVGPDRDAQVERGLPVV